MGTWQLQGYVYANGGIRPVNSSRIITLADDSITFGFTDMPEQVERSFSILAEGAQRYELELRDRTRETTAITTELAPCGILIESEGVCDAFCENVASEFPVPTDEQIREAIVNQMGDHFNDEVIEQIYAQVRESIAQGPQPLFREHSFFVRVTDDQ